MVSMFADLLFNLGSLCSKTRPPNQQPGRVTSTYRTWWKHTTGFKVCGLSQSQFSSNLDSTSHFFSNLKTSTKNVSQFHVVVCLATEMPSFNPSWHATHDKLPAALAAPDMKKYVPKMVFDTSTYEKMMYYKYTYSKDLNVYQTQLYV